MTDEIEEQYRTLYENALVGLWTSEIEGGSFIRANNTAAKIAGYENAEDLMNNCDAIKLFDYETRIEFIRELREQGVKSGFEAILIDKNNNIKEISVSGKINQEKGTIEGVFIDISDLKKTQTSLKESEEIFRPITEQALMGICIIQDFEVKYVNQQMVDIFGYSMEEVYKWKPKDFFRVLHPESRDFVIEQIKKKQQGSKDVQNHYISKAFRKDGSIIWVENYSKSFIYQGRPADLLTQINITDKKKSEEKLKDSEEKFRTITEQALMGISILQDNVVKYVNKQFADLLEYSIEEIRNWGSTGFINTVYPEDREMVFNHAILRQSGINDDVNHYFYRGLTKTGKILWFEVYAKTITYEGRSADLVTVIDISETKEAEELLKESEEKYRLFLQNFQGVAYQLDVKLSRTILIHGNLEEICGYSEEDFIDGNVIWMNLIHLDDVLKVRKEGEKLSTIHGYIAKNEYRIYHKSGELKWVRDIGRAIYDNSGDILLIQGAIYDITEQKRAEEKLRESEEKYRNIIENTKEGYFEVDLKGNMTFFNDALCQWTGYPRDELNGMNYREYMTKENVKRTFKAFNVVYNTGITQRNFEYDIVRKDGYHLFGESSVYLRYDSNGNKIGFNGFLRDITEKREAEQKSRESEENYRSIFNSSPDYIYITDMSGDFLDANQIFLDRIKLPLDELKGMNFIDFYAGQRLTEILGIIKNLRYGEQVKSLDVRAKTPFGEVLDLEVNSVPIKEGGMVTKVISIARDVSERKIAAQKLKDSEEKYRDMIHNLDIGFFQVNWDGTILNVNPEFRRIMGMVQFEDLSNKNMKDFWRREEDLKNYSEELLKNNVVDNYIGHGKDVYGEELILQTDSHLIRDENGKPVRVEGTVINITEKFKLEQKLKRSEKRHRFLFENTPLAIILSDTKGILRDMNPATQTLTGYKKEEIIGRNFINLSMIHPDYLSMTIEHFENHVKGLEQPPLEMPFYHKDGSLLWVDVITNPIKLGDDIFLQIIAHDITERKKAELLIKEELDKLKELDQIRKDLISRVSHELKTPLIPVMGGAELLLDVYKDKFESEPLEIIEMIEKGGKRLAKLVEKLLDITRIEYEKFELEKSRTNLSEIVRAGVRDMKYSIDKRELDLYLVVPDELYMQIDGFRIEQVVTNLLSNAIKNTPPKGRISVMLEKYGNWAIISVSDTGIGFTEEEIKKVFIRFGKFERYGEGLEYIDMKGSGLGLYISKQIVDLHNGKIWVESTGRNRGCIFKIRIPIE